MSETHPSFAEALRVWARVAALSFGGPAAQIAVMHRILVEEKRWIGEARFLHALNYCMLLPGPEATQLAIYIGWLLHRTAGGIVAGVLFVLPGIVALMALSWIYALWGKIPFVEAVFFGLKAAVLAVVVEALIRIGRRALRNRAMVGLAALAFITIFFFKLPFPVIVVAAALIGLFGARVRPDLVIPPTKQEATPVDRLFANGAPAHTRPSFARAIRVTAVWLPLWLLPVVALLLSRGAEDVFSRIAFFFSEMAVVTFGGAYAVLAYVAQRAVETYGWLGPGEMLDGLAMAETTPGPLIMVLQFVGFMAAFRGATGLPPLLSGTLGGLLATWVTFVPSFFFIFLGAPYVETLRGNKALAGALGAITAAVVGVILNLAVWFALHTIFAETRPFAGFFMRFDMPVAASLNWAALFLAAGAMLAMLRFHVDLVWTLLACAALGAAWRLAF